MTPVPRDVRAVARELADEVLFPAAMRVDGLDSLLSIVQMPVNIHHYYTNRLLAWYSCGYSGYK